MPATGTKRATNLSIDGTLLAEARALNINVSSAAASGIAAAVAAEKTRIWKIENREAIESTNNYFRENGLPQAKYRRI